MPYSDPEERKAKQREYQRRWREKHPEYARGWAAENRELINEQKRARYAAHRAEELERARDYNSRPEVKERARQRYQENREAILARTRARVRANPEAKGERGRRYYQRTREVRREHAKEYQLANAEAIRSRASARLRALRLEVLNHYGKGDPCCACCGERQQEFLQLDHVNGDGAAHRRQVGRTAVLRWVKEQGFPEGFRVLCANCNWSLGIHGYCPHQRESRT